VNDTYHDYVLKVSGVGYKEMILEENVSYNKTLKVLLQYNATPDIYTNDRILPTPIFSSVGDFQNMSRLIKAGADVNKENDQKHSVLYKACEVTNSVDTVDLLVRSGASVDPENCRPLFIALTRRRMDVVDYLRQHGA
jgi:ankyrin repeat protein